MHIIEIILEGFKSYAQRTVIKDFDPQFNAITGLNGSGKSNIMDSILFGLGMTKEWDLLRVQNVKELIYKSGHAGITKAEVSIRFDNRDKSMSPMGYENCEQIVVTRQVTQDKSKYFVNGVKEQQNKVKNMFRSVQLNIDNPHFYVGQGRITKIINLKSQELIAMLEETAGTALYNEKKKESQKIMQKKEDKLNEINDLIEKDIKPQIEKLRREREQYLLWKSQETELIRLTKLLKSYEFYKVQKRLDERKSNLANNQNYLTQLNDDKTLRNTEKNQIEKKLEECKRLFNSNADRQFQNVEKKLNEQKKQVAKQMNDEKNRKKRISDIQSEINNLEQQVQENKSAKDRAENKLQIYQQYLQEFEQSLKDKIEQQDEAQLNMEQMKKGQISNDDAKNQILKSISEANNHLLQSKNTIKSIDDQIRYLEREIQKNQDNLQNAQGENQAKEKQMQILQKEVGELEEEINSSNFNEIRMNELREELRKLENSGMQISHQISQFTTGQNWIFKLQFRDPESGFDRSRVRGRVFTLFEQKDDKFLKALESGAGGKLQQIVVDSEITSKLLLQRRCFDFHCTFIPNNKITNFQPNPQVIQFANQAARNHGGFAIPAHEAINFSEMNRNSMLYVFGGFIICSSAEIAKEIANNPQRNLRYRCVTLEGDIFDTQGLLSGGYMNSNNMVLSRYQELRRLQKDQYDIRNQQKRIEDEYDQMKQDLDYYNGLRADLEAKSKKLEYLNNSLKRASGQRYEDQIETQKIKIEDLKEQRKRTEILCQQHEKEIQELKKDNENFSSNQNIKDVYTKKLKNLKNDIQMLKQKIVQQKQDISQQEVEKDQSEKNKSKIEKNLEKEKQNLIMEKSQLEVDQGSLKSYQDTLKELQKQYESLEKEKFKFDKDLNNYQSSLSKIVEELKKIEEDIKKNEQKVHKMNAEIKSYSENLQNLEKNFTWIPEHKQYFGQPGTDFDYSNNFDYNKLSGKYSDLKIDQDKLSKKVNFKVEAMSDNVEKKFLNLKDKREKLQQDKLNLETNMDELDKKRQITLEKCYMSVNKNFGEIFSDLLPNAFAKLNIVDQNDISNGLELSVKLGKAWRTSLSELSGGQRSLLALSFVLSLLLYKPAPFYILDEVDAALDLSHTENIGHMISNRFPQSQFLIISHKDGMYQNANVLFKTSIVDGNSKIDRFQFQSKQKKKKLTADNQK